MKRVFILVAVITIVSVAFLQVFAVADPGYDPNLVNNGIVNTTKSVWATVVVIVQILSVACVVFAGLRYMFASADQKADIKQGLAFIAIGAILVFSAVTIINFVVSAANEIL